MSSMKERRIVDGVALAMLMLTAALISTQIDGNETREIAELQTQKPKMHRVAADTITLTDSIRNQSVEFTVVN